LHLWAEAGSVFSMTFRAACCCALVLNKTSAFPHWRGTPAPNCFGGPSLNLFQVLNVCLVLEVSKLDIVSTCDGLSHFTQHPFTFLHQLPVLQLVQPRLLLTFFAARTETWLMFILLSTNTPNGLFSRVALQPGSP